MMFATLGEFIKMHEGLRAFIDFNIENPTGHYKLHLENPVEYALAGKLQLLDRWEVVLDDRRGRADISQRKNKSHFRNELFGARALTIFAPSMAEWILPEYDVLEFDYVTAKRPTQDANDRLHCLQ